MDDVADVDDLVGRGRAAEGDGVKMHRADGQYALARTEPQHGRALPYISYIRYECSSRARCASMGVGSFLLRIALRLTLRACSAHGHGRANKPPSTPVRSRRS